MDWILWGSNMMRFFKTFMKPVQNVKKAWKYALKRTRYLISVFTVSFNLYKHILTTLLQKWSTKFPCLYSWSSLCCRYGINSILLHCQNIFPRNPEISLRRFLLKFVVKQIPAQGWQAKQKQIGTILLRYNHQ